MIWTMSALVTLMPVLLGLTLAVTALALFAGIYAMGRGGAFNEKWGNRLMRARVGLQGLAVALMILFFISTVSQP